MSDETTAELYQRVLASEERRYAQLKKVFGSPEGIEVLEWLLTDLCGFWRGSLDSDRTLGKFDLGRTLFNQVCMADIEIGHTLLARRRNMAIEARNEERRRLEKAAKNG